MGLDPNVNEIILGFIVEILPGFLLVPKGRRGLDRAAEGEIWDNLSDLDLGLADGSDTIPRPGSCSWLSFPVFLGVLPSK